MGKCKICGHKTSHIIYFGKMPLANGLLKRPSDKEFFYDLSVVFCPNCFMVQLKETVKPKMMFHDQYQFISSTSKKMAAHFKKIANEIIKTVLAKQNPFIVEIGCNDGIMLKHIAKKGINHLGIEPSGNVASLARKNKMKVIEKFFNKKTASQILKKYGQADIIFGANVITHIENINSVFEGAHLLLKEDGIFFFEEPYLLDIIRKTSFDQIYDEHVYFFSGLSISKLAEKHKMQLVDMRYQNVHGGSMRYYLKTGKSNLVKKRVHQLLRIERKFKLDKINGYSNFQKKVDKICSDLRKILKKIKKQGNQVVGYGATAKSATLLNYAQISPELINYISDITPNKIGKFNPGTHIPIRSHQVFVKDNPPYAILFAWNHKNEIFKKEKRYRQRGGKFILYFPKVVIE